jgi:hypothetical protein
VPLLDEPHEQECVILMLFVFAFHAVQNVEIIMGWNNEASPLSGDSCLCEGDTTSFESNAAKLPFEASPK